jgi:DNA-binding MltR family transcriptional regulator
MLYLRNFKNLTRLPPTVEQAEQVEKEFYGTSDRACAILFAGWVELALDRALKSVFRADISSTLSKRLFEFDGSVGTFSAKIDVAYGLGLFGQQSHHDLELIRAIRNGFAHCGQPLEFTTAETADVCAHLQIPDTDCAIIPHYFYSLPDDKEDYWFDKSHPKTKFVIACHSLVYHLLRFSNRTTRQAPETSQLT